MTPVHQTLISLTAAGAGRGSTPRASLRPEEWDTLFDLACQQNVAPIVCHAIEQGQTDIPLTVKLKFATVKQQALSKHHHIRQTLAELLRLFNAHGIDTMILKGLAISRHYPCPELRHFGDIDIYQYGRWQEADALVADTFGTTVTTKTHHHSKYTFRGILVENHYDFISRYGNRDSRAIERLLKQEASRPAATADIGGERCLLPPPNLAALFYLRHMATHFAADRITLRHLLDWTFFCQAERDSVDWALVQQTATKYGFLPFANAMEALCSTHFGHSPCLQGTPQENLPERMMEEFLSCQFKQTRLGQSTPLEIIRFKWKRLWAGRWKHDICYASPWSIDLLYSLHSKVLKPHSILH